MTISRLAIHAVRNLNQQQLNPTDHINIFTGPNGSGKTSLLEAVHILGMARSFRTNKLRHVIKSDEDTATIFAEIDPHGSGFAQPLGVEKRAEDSARIRYAGDDIDLSTLAELLPLQVIDSTTFDLLDGSPKVRRQYIDWGAFHAEKSFISVWRAFNRVLKQRNSLLKYGKINGRVREAWDHEFITLAQRLTELREGYIQALTPTFEQIIGQLLPSREISLGFYAGWDQKRPLDALLNDNFERDMRQGFTSAGPQRADLRVKANGHSAAERLSRGQKKLAVSALKLAQGVLFNRMTARPCIYLIDDLPSELDAHHCALFCEFIEQMHSQCFITCVDSQSLPYTWQQDTPVAHYSIKDGRITRLSPCLET
ncbi:MAG: DNA replication/repair protein RecF [Pontibacterium sp.]